MKKEDLIKLGLTDDAVIESIMKLHGLDIESHKTKVSDLQLQLEAATKQLTDANSAIEGFKKLNPEQLQAAADEWKTKYETATKEAADSLAKIKFDHALETALTGAKVKNAKTLVPLLSMDKLKLNDDGTISGLDEQIAKIKTENDYLFSDAKEIKVVTGTKNQPVITDAFEAALLKGAGIKPSESLKG